MTAGAVGALRQAAPAGRASAWGLLVLAGAILAAGAVIGDLLPWAAQLPPDRVVPLKAWVTAFFRWLVTEFDLGFFTFRELTRAIAWLLAQPLGWTEALLYKGWTTAHLPQLPWLAVVAGVGAVGHAAGGPRLALFAAGGFLYLALFGVWSDAMQTLSIVIVAVALAAAVGLALGITATLSRRIEAVLTVMFDIMQATPHLAYLAPVVVLFGFGQVPATVATVVFAMPPMARCTILGLRTVAPAIVESGRMSGCTPWQLLWMVRLPAARQTLMVGLNQAIMQTLAMAVIASLVGASGLGHKLLFALQQLRLGTAVENGVAIVVIAVVLDRISQGFARRKPTRRAGSLWKRNPEAMVFVAVLAATLVASIWSPALQKLPKDLTVTTAPAWDWAIRWMSLHLFEHLAPLRDGLTVEVLIPLRNLFVALPWSMMVALVALLGWHFGGWRLMLLSAGLVAFIAVIGFWTPAMMTLYLTSIAVAICILIGVPVGIWASRSERVARVVLGACDTVQTFPSFIYLIPVIMLFRVGDLASIIAILGYASVPAVRYTYLGLRLVPSATVEAARASGCTPAQLLWKVELPLAFPEIMLGINQTIMMALAMTAITALIGSRDLGQEILKALPDVDTGRGVLAGLCIAVIGITADRLIGSWSRRRKAELGLA